MKAHEIQAGDVLLDADGGFLYEVEEIVDVVPSHVKVRVQYVDGGDGYRAWDPEDETPLIHLDPETYSRPFLFSGRGWVVSCKRHPRSNPMLVPLYLIGEHEDAHRDGA